MIEKRLPDYFRNGKIVIPDNIREKLEKMQYRVLGNHSSIEICHWTKKSLLDENACYKQRFYGVDSHMCAQIAPTTLWCSNNCIFCWRPMEFMKSINIKDEQVDDPEIIINEAVEKRKQLLIGFKGNEKVCKEKMNQVMNEFPNHWAISLSGEPMLYPKMDKMVNLLKSNNSVRSVFIVSNGQETDAIEKLIRKNALPTQFYISIAGSNKDIYKKIHRPVHRDYWERFTNSLALLKKMERSVIRLTIIKGINDKPEQLVEFAKLFNDAAPDFIEVKSYMFLGYSMQRLSHENMPSHEYIRVYSEKLLQYLDNYHIEDEQPESRIVLLKRNDSDISNIITFHDNLKPITINEDTTINTIRSYYRRTIPLLRSMGIDTERRTCRTIREIAKHIGISKEEIIEKINNFLMDTYA